VGPPIFLPYCARWISSASSDGHCDPTAGVVSQSHRRNFRVPPCERPSGGKFLISRAEIARKPVKGAAANRSAWTVAATVMNRVRGRPKLGWRIEL